jgi:hypothetical protein
MPKTNDPYSRPINATRPEGQMLQGEFYGEHATDKRLHNATGGRVVHQVRPMQSVVPAWPEAETESAPKTTRKRKPTTPSPEPTTPTTDVTSLSDEQSPEPNGQPLDAITEDDLFG